MSGRARAPAAALRMGVTVPTMWIAGAAAALSLAIAGWLWRRGRRQAPATPGVDARRAAAAAARAIAAGDAGAATAIAADSRPTAAAMAAESAPEQDATLLLRVYALAFAAAPAPDASAAARAAHAEIAAAAVAVLARIDAHPRYTPRRPQLLPQLTRAINDPAAGAQAIAAILGQDPALAGNLLRIANSAAYRRQAEPIESLERAVALLGTEGLRQIVLAALLQPVIADDGSALGRCAALLWEHTLLAAEATARHAADTEGEDPAAAQLLALLQGLGAVAVVQVVRDAYARQPRLVPDADTLAGLLQDWTAPVAQAISQDWALSKRMQQALAAQHHRSPPPHAANALGRSLRAGCRQAALRLLDAAPR